jgi:hypothetical protein
MLFEPNPFLQDEELPGNQNIILSKPFCELLTGSCYNFNISPHIYAFIVDNFALPGKG